MAGQSTIFPIFLRAEYREGQLQGFISDAKRSADMAKAEFRSVGAVLDEALSRKRNASGSLDLGIDELKAEAAAQRARAIAAREVAEATARLAPEQAKAGVSLRASAAAAKLYANETDRLATELEQQVRIQDLVQQELNRTASATDAVVAAKRRGTNASGNVINSVRAERTAFVQLGQQLQDVGVQYQMGTSALTIMTQQLPQAAFALSGLSDSTNKTKAAVGQFATILAGPVGGAIVIATALLGPFIVELFKSGDAAESAAKSVSELVAEKKRSAAEARNAAIAEDVFSRTLDGVTEAAGRNREAIQKLTDAKRTDSEETLRNSRIQLANALALQFNTQQQLFNAKALLDAQVARATGPTQAADLAALGIADKQAALDKTLANFITGAGEIAKIQKDIDAAAILVSVERGLSGAEGEIKRRYETELEGLKKTAAARGLSAKQIEREAAAIKAREQASMDALKPGASARTERSTATERSRVAAANQLATFSESAAEQVQRINERFDQQPRLIDQGKQATRQLETIIGEVNKRLAEGQGLTAKQREELEKIKAAAEAAEPVIQKAMVQPVEDLLRASEDRIAIQELIAQGREDEAVALQEIVRLEEQFGRQSEADLKRVREQVLFEQQRTRELRAQAELLELQADVARTVADDLRNVFSGRGTFADLLKNFQQSLRDLQGARLFENLFGPAFRELEEQLRGNTPQGRANARYTAEVEKTAATTSRAEVEIGRLADAAGEAATLLNDIGTTRALPGYGGNLTGRGGAAVAAGIFGAGTNGIFAAATGRDGITVNGNRKAEVDVSTMSTKEIADRIAKATVDGMLGPLEDLLGPQFTAQLGAVLSGALSGFVRGGTPGAVLGGAKGLVDLLGGSGGGISRALGTAGDGAAVGTQINGIISALGVRGSSTGAQIGGAIGSFIPIPGGNIIGSIAGSLLGGLLKGTPRGSATIGGVGGGLGVTGVVGNRGSLRETASGLAGSVLEAVNNIARELGASVNAGAGRVSIGQRGENLRVDPSGGGATRIANGAIDFGDDAEAAIAFAVQDLIRDGVISGLRASENRLLQAGDDIEAAIRDVLDFRSVFDRLKEIKDPVGFAVDQINKEFERLIDLFERAGASTEEFAQLEELYNLQRAEAIRDATDRVVGSLRSLLQDLTIGDSGLSLRSRRANALGDFNALAGRVAAGDATAFDDFAEISQQLLDIERQLFGSTQSYFDRLAQITALTEQAIDGQTNVSSIGGAAPNPFDDRAELSRSIDQQTTEVTGWLRAINDNLIALNPNSGPVASYSGFGSSVLNPATIANF